jgi:hypothetical protein
MTTRKATPDVTTFAPHANGGRTSSFRTPDGLRVTVTSDDEETNWSARSLAEELAAHCAVEPAAYSDLRGWTREDRVEWVCVRLSSGAVTLGARLSVGPYTPAVPAEHLFAVIGRQGQPIVLAHDAFEAARSFVDAEERGPSELGDECYAMDTDAEQAARATADRADEWAWRLAGYNAALDEARAQGGIA